MDDICLLITRATAARAANTEKQRAFGEIVRRFQDLAFGCAYAVLGDFHLAEDAAQDAFVAAWRNLDQLRQPEAFPGWLKRIVLTQCNRLTRGKRVDLVSLDGFVEVPSAQPEPQAAAERSELRAAVHAAIRALPEHERVVTTLFYINDYSQNEIAGFLELPVSTIKKRLFCARQKLRQTMLNTLRDTLQERRPSRDEGFVNTVALYNEALDSFVSKVKQDRYILAAILFGSLSYAKVWRKSDIDIILVGRDEKRAPRDYYLVENGINIHAIMTPRSKFRQALEGGLQGSFFHSMFSRSTLLFSHDETIEEYYRNVQRMGARDRQMQLLRAAGEVIYTLAKAEKWYEVTCDLTYSFLWIMYCVRGLATIEVLLHDEVTGREVIHQALRHNEPFFNAVYYDLIHGKKDAQTIGRALGMINGYLDDRLDLLFRPVLDYLADAGAVRSTTDLDDYFKKQAQMSSLAGVYEWLAEKNIIRKIPSPLRLTEKSRVEVEEAAYYYDGLGA